MRILRWMENIEFKATGGFAIATILMWITAILGFIKRVLSRCVK